MVDVGGDDRPAPGHLVAHERGVEALAQGDELHLGRDLAPAGVVHLGDGPARARPAGGGASAPAPGERLGGRTGRPATTPGRRRAASADPARVVLDVAPLVDPRRPQRRQAVARVAARAARVVQPDGLVGRVSADLA